MQKFIPFFSQFLVIVHDYLMLGSILSKDPVLTKFLFTFNGTIKITLSDFWLGMCKNSPLFPAISHNCARFSQLEQQLKDRQFSWRESACGQKCPIIYRSRRHNCFSVRKDSTLQTLIYILHHLSHNFSVCTSLADSNLFFNAKITLEWSKFWFTFLSSDSMLSKNQN